MSNRQDRPLAKKLLHALGLLALALFLLYVAVQFVLIFHRSYKTETAIRYTLAESLNLPIYHASSRHCMTAAWPLSPYPWHPA